MERFTPIIHNITKVTIVDENYLYFNGNIMSYVTGFAKTILNYTFDFSQITNLNIEPTMALLC